MVALVNLNNIKNLVTDSNSTCNEKIFLILTSTKSQSDPQDHH